MHPLDQEIARLSKEIGTGNTWSYWITVVAAVATVGGAVAAVGAAIVSRALYSRQSSLSALQSRRDEDQANELRRDLAEAATAAAEANARAEEARKAAETERLERVKLELRMVPRILNRNQMRALSKSLSLFSHTRVNILAVAKDAEVGDFSRQLWAAFGDSDDGAGWKASWAEGREGIDLVTGVLVELTAGYTASDRAAAEGVAGELRRYDFLVRGPMQEEQKAVGVQLIEAGKIDPLARIKILVGIRF